MKKRFFLVAAAVIVVTMTAISIALPGPCMARTASDPQTRAQAFYTWYIKTSIESFDRHTVPLLNDKIPEFVSKDTLERLRDDYRHDRLPGDVDYFLKVQDYDERDWLAHIDAHPAIALGNVNVVPVTFGSTHRITVVVFMRHMGGAWKITKVDDALDYR